MPERVEARLGVLEFDSGAPSPSPSTPTPTAEVS
jgi:hypothetical protein